MTENWKHLFKYLKILCSLSLKIKSQKIRGFIWSTNLVLPHEAPILNLFIQHYYCSWRLCPSIYCANWLSKGFLPKKTFSYNHPNDFTRQTITFHTHRCETNTWKQHALRERAESITEFNEDCTTASCEATPIWVKYQVIRTIEFLEWSDLCSDLFYQLSDGYASSQFLFLLFNLAITHISR